MTSINKSKLSASASVFVPKKSNIDGNQLISDQIISDKSNHNGHYPCYLQTANNSSLSNHSYFVDPDPDRYKRNWVITNNTKVVVLNVGGPKRSESARNTQVKHVEEKEQQEKNSRYLSDRIVPPTSPPMLLTILKQINDGVYVWEESTSSYEGLVSEEEAKSYERLVSD